MVQALEWFSMCLNLLEIPLTYGTMNVTWYIASEEGRLLLNGFVMGIH
jgi:hypothetical protein